MYLNVNVKTIKHVKKIQKKICNLVVDGFLWIQKAANIEGKIKNWTPSKLKTLALERYY